MKVSFIEPPPVTERAPERFAGCTYELYHFPDLVNLNALTVLAREGADVRYLDCALEGMDRRGFERWLAADDSDVYVVHGVILAKPTDLAAARLILERRPGARILFHGPEPTRVPADYLIDPRVSVIRGEVEPAIAGWLLRGDPTGTSRLEQGTPVHAPLGPDVPFDDLPVPARDHPAFRRYLYRFENPKFRARPFMTMIASRGCSFRCVYCVPTASSFSREMEAYRLGQAKPRVKAASSARVVAEFQDLARLGFKAVMLLDDQFLWAKARTLEICRGIAGLGIEWGCLSRADFLTDPEVVEALSVAGCVSIDIGVESLNQQVLDSVRKDLKVEDVHSAVALLARHGIRAKLNIMIGVSPVETEDSLRRTIDAVCRMPVTEVMFSVATPFKGTPYHDDFARSGFLVDDTEAINPMGKAVTRLPHLSPERIEEIARDAYRTFYLRPRIALSRLRSARSPGDLWQDAKIAARLLTRR